MYGPNPNRDPNLICPPGWRHLLHMANNRRMTGSVGKAISHKECGAQAIKYTLLGENSLKLSQDSATNSYSYADYMASAPNKSCTHPETQKSHVSTYIDALDRGAWDSRDRGEVLSHVLLGDQILIFCIKCKLSNKCHKMQFSGFFC